MHSCTAVGAVHGQRQAGHLRSAEPQCVQLLRAVLLAAQDAGGIERSTTAYKEKSTLHAAWAKQNASSCWLCS